MFTSDLSFPTSCSTFVIKCLHSKQCAVIPNNCGYGKVLIDWRLFVDAKSKSLNGSWDWSDLKSIWLEFFWQNWSALQIFSDVSCRIIDFNIYLWYCLTVFLHIFRGFFCGNDEHSWLSSFLIDFLNFFLLKRKRYLIIQFDFVKISINLRAIDFFALFFLLSQQNFGTTHTQDYYCCLHCAQNYLPKPNFDRMFRWIHCNAMICYRRHVDSLAKLLPCKFLALVRPNNYCIFLGCHRSEYLHKNRLTRHANNSMCQYSALIYTFHARISPDHDKFHILDCHRSRLSNVFVCNNWLYYNVPRS